MWLVSQAARAPRSRCGCRSWTWEDGQRARPARHAQRQHLALGSARGSGTQHGPLSTHPPLSQRGCWLQSGSHEAGGFQIPQEPVRASKAISPSRESAAGLKLHCSIVGQAGPQLRNCLPPGGVEVGGLNLACTVEQAKGVAPRA